ncbi:hypothetical protein NXS98_11015 [Fontisphaera persica]|uniref:hypothetical protein n=1 Tax=Fontisphaera persica TaxID=2974023 RepID=UPI0024C003EA|nr:hypothetical protein [Fontisphaera persica]WCJ58256.1 hypothetical protein NXS98_11015 [Fontisphaera persica]
MAGKNKKWSREELTLALSLYRKIPFGQMHSRTPEVIELAALLGRTPSAVALKLCNFARLDPKLAARGVKGLRHGSNDEIEIGANIQTPPKNFNAKSPGSLMHTKGEKKMRLQALKK